LALEGFGGYGGTGAPPSANKVYFGLAKSHGTGTGGCGYGGTGAPPSAVSALKYDLGGYGGTGAPPSAT